MKTLTLAAVSLGCAKNRVDTEEVLGYLAAKGYLITDNLQFADVIFVNTCAFIDSAQQESVDTLLKVASEKKSIKVKIIAAGCLVEQFGSDILNKVPEIDGAIGVHSYSSIDKLMSLVQCGKRTLIRKKPGDSYCSFFPRLLTTPIHSVNVKIAEGCSNCCHYCRIPMIRGPYRSRDPEEIVDEIGVLVKSGAKEVNLIAQDTTAYGSDELAYPDLTGLIKMILSLKDIFWLRIMYTYPDRINNSLIELIASEKRICNYLDIPVQHLSNAVLARMNRSYNSEQIEELIKQIILTVPDIALRTTCMVGYPGEKSRDFTQLLAFIEKGYFKHLGAFTFSRQKGTIAAKLSDQVPQRLADKRFRRLMSKQRSLSLQQNLRQVGNEVTVLVEKIVNRNAKWYYGRTEYQAPEVDGGVYFRSEKPLKSGDWVSVEISAASPYHLLAVKSPLLKNTLIER
jgi:ribosomal protein S12 methylthiotransferase